MAKIIAVALSPVTLIGIYRYENGVMRLLQTIDVAADSGWPSASMTWTMSPDAKHLFVGTTNSTNIGVTTSLRYERVGDLFEFRGTVLADESALRHAFGANVAWSKDGKMIATQRHSRSTVQPPYLRVMKLQDDGTWLDLTVPSSIPGAPSLVAFNATGNRLIAAQAGVTTGVRVYSISGNTVALQGAGTYTPSVYPTDIKTPPTENYAWLLRATSGAPVFERINLDTLAGTVYTLTAPTDAPMTIKGLCQITDDAIFVDHQTGGAPYPRNSIANTVYWPMSGLASAGLTMGPIMPAQANTLSRSTRLGWSNSFMLMPSAGAPRNYVIEWSNAAPAGPLPVAFFPTPGVVGNTNLWGSSELPEATVQLYNGKLDNLINHGSNVFKLMLVTEPFTFDPTDATLAEALTGAAEISGNGWPVGGPVVANIAVTEVDGLTRVTANSTGANASGGAISATKALLYDDTNDIPIAYLNFGETKTANDGERLSFEFNSSGIVAFVPV